MKIALVGSTGYIGKKLYSELSAFLDKDVIRIDRNRDDKYALDLRCAEKFDFNLLDDIEYLVFTSAVSSPDKCAESYDECRRVNVEGTIFFIEEAIKHNVKTLFFSSDAVYGMDDGHPFTELSELNPITPYGCMKAEVERYFCKSSLFKSLRLSYVISENDKFTKYCIDCYKRGKIAEIYHPFYRNVVSIDIVLEAVKWMISNWDRYKLSTLCVAGNELVSRVRIVDEINRVIRPNLNYCVKNPYEEFYKNRPALTEMTSIYLNKILNTSYKNICFSDIIYSIWKPITII